MDQSAQHLGLEQPSLRPRIQMLLDKIASSVINVPLQAEMQAFLQKMSV
jgi:hypothetical protein